MNNSQSSTAQRYSNIEMLRIVCMAMIVLSHYFHGVPSGEHAVTISHVAMQLLSSGAKIAVNVFVIITGYFLIRQKFRWLKLCKFFSCTYFWSLIILTFAIFMFGIEKINPELIKKSLFPLTPLNWFARAYLILYIMFPLLNKFVLRVDKRKLLYVIMALTMYFYIIPTIMNVSKGGYINSMFMFSDMYMIGAYIRQHESEKLIKKIKIAGAVGAFVLYSSILIFDYMALSDPFYRVQGHVLSFTSSGANLFVLMAAMGLFVWGKDVKMAYCPRVNIIAATTFGIYLIHENALLVGWLWGDVVQVSRFFDTPFAVPHMLLSTAAVFAVCSVLEYLRIQLVERPLMCVLERRFSR